MYSWTSPQPWGQKKVAVVVRFKQESMCGLSAKKSGYCWEVGVAVSGGVTVKIYFNQMRANKEFELWSWFEASTVAQEGRL